MIVMTVNGEYVYNSEEVAKSRLYANYSNAGLNCTKGRDDKPDNCRIHTDTRSKWMIENAFICHCEMILYDEVVNLTHVPDEWFTCNVILPEVHDPTDALLQCNSTTYSDAIHDEIGIRIRTEKRMKKLLYIQVDKTASRKLVEMS
ncbi:hypothetical protein EVAR_59687_1 [Eumeta japonica]|uniref:Uncharacterized protein n=1 Tax=Eumeta variegata TaxID=151549 RepID=A0A4C1Z3U7_EUMVA|nr:hypothetical protein EVAR_59687_1 [Eumeta japonica]